MVHILVTLRADLPPRHLNKHVKNKSVFELFFGIILGSFLVPFWRPNGTQMPLDGLLGHPVGPLRFPRKSKGVHGRPRSSFLTISGAILADFGEHEGCLSMNFKELGAPNYYFDIRHSLNVFHYYTLSLIHISEPTRRS